MKRYLLLVALLAGQLVFAQTKDAYSLPEVERVISYLASDEMRGRRTGSPEIERAAAFIGEEFKKAGLQPWKNGSFLQEFTMLRPSMKELKYELEDAAGDVKNVIVVTAQKELKLDEKHNYELARISATDNIFEQAREMASGKKNRIVLVDTAHAKNFSRLTFLKRQLFSDAPTTVFLLGTSLPSRFTIKAEHQFQEMKMANVVGILPGKSKKDEMVIFSAHYDHVGVGRPVDGDSIYNGANDNAAGTTAMIMLARHFSKMGSQERTLVFVGFTAEEIGGYGSQYFSAQYDPARIMAMFNIEMVGTESRWGKNSAYITGFDKTNMGSIMQKNLQGSKFSFHPDPYTDQNLFYRSDNATLARLGVPAHTISTAKMENEPHYHKPSDEIKTLDLENMVEIIRAIAISSRSIVSGKDSPSRVSNSQ